MPPPSSEPCELLAWDSQFWGFSIGRVRAQQLDPNVLVEIDAWSKRHATRCIYLLAKANDFETTRLAEEAGFRLVDVRMTYAWSLAGDGFAKESSKIDVIDVRQASEFDLPELRRIASTSYQSTRFYHDPCFPRTLCNALYETWIEKSYHGYADALFVAEQGGQVEGYISCHLGSGASQGSIGLVGIHPAGRGRGVAQQLVRHACAWFRAAGASQVNVVTQARNVDAQRMYQRSGFLLADVRLWFHRWTATP